MSMTTSQILSVLDTSPIVPVLTINDIAHAEPLAIALAEGGTKAAEVTLRTPIALEALKIMKQTRPDLLVGAGTILSPADLDATLEAGSDFSVSPGATVELARAMLASGVPAFPGTATASEAMTRLEEGFEVVKFFPAEAVGGAKALKALTAPIQNLKVMPTGGIGPGNMDIYLAIPNVVAVGGGWLASPADLAGRDWAGIKQRCREGIAQASAVRSKSS